MRVALPNQTAWSDPWQTRQPAMTQARNDRALRIAVLRRPDARAEAGGSARRAWARRSDGRGGNRPGRCSRRAVRRRPRERHPLSAISTARRDGARMRHCASITRARGLSCSCVRPCRSIRAERRPVHARLAGEPELERLDRPGEARRVGPRGRRPARSDAAARPPDPASVRSRTTPRCQPMIHSARSFAVPAPPGSRSRREAPRARAGRPRRIAPPVHGVRHAAQLG